MCQNTDAAMNILRAVKYGALIELALCGASVVYVLSGGFGPCGPSRDVPPLVQFIHQPGLLFAAQIAEEGSFGYLVCGMFITTLLLTGLSAIALKWCGRDSRLAE
jgi:hypothetical protein